MLNIGFDATAIPSNRVGAGNYIFSLVQSLSKVDIKNNYYIFAKAEHIQEWRISNPNFHFITVDISSKALRLLWEQTGLPLAIKRWRIEILHSPHYTAPIIKPCKSVVTFCDMTFQLIPEKHRPIQRIFFPLMMSWNAQHADKLIAISESTRQDAIRLLKIEANKIITIPLAANKNFRVLPNSDIEQICNRYNLKHKKYIYYVGALEPRKNVPILIEAYAKIAADFIDIPLVIVGKKAWMYDEIFERVSSLGLQDRVHFLGHIPEPDLIGLYNGSRVFVYPSIYEGFGLPVLEAMQCGTPVVTTNISSMPEVAGDAAILIAPDDTQGLANALQQLLLDDNLVNQLSQQGLARATKFSWDICAEETRKVYESL
ncbi:group 1 glycosyl transferase [Nostoc carneum NIES-2107]|nr:group 1 glycosyl transferase [Nostoc carneum NIES-2107]